MRADTASSSDANGVDLVRDGRPTSVIVVPRKALPVVRFAAEELQHHVEASTGATLPIREEGDATEVGVRASGRRESTCHCHD